MYFKGVYMNKRTIIAEIIDVANELDKNNFSKEADYLTRIANDLFFDDDEAEPNNFVDHDDHDSDLLPDGDISLDSDREYEQETPDYLDTDEQDTLENDHDNLQRNDFGQESFQSFLDSMLQKG